MADVNRGQRPLSPHLQVYRPQLTSMSSIMVRITAIASLVVAVILVCWLVAAATSDSAFQMIDNLLRSWIGDIVLLGATWAIWYHMMGRLRHVIWDFGYCLDVKTSEKLAIAMFCGATVLTAVTILIV